MKDQYIAAKERWARKMAGKSGPTARSTNRLPPGQRQVRNFPVLDLGLQPEVPLDKWELKIQGLVENPVTLNWEQFLALRSEERRVGKECRCGWGRDDYNKENR